MRKYTLITRPEDVSEEQFISSVIEKLSPYISTINFVPVVLSENTPNIYILNGLDKTAEELGFESPVRPLTNEELLALRAELNKGNLDALLMNPRMLVSKSGMKEGSKYTKPVSDLSAEEFEKHIAEVFKAIEKKGAKVTWNSSMSDPYTPKQKRQIDVLIEKDGKRVHVECRHRGRRQNVNWIEELDGKGRALNADLMIGISSSGFTEGATNTARGLGVRLKEIGSIDENGELWWTDGIFISTAKFNLENIKLTFQVKDYRAPEYYFFEMNAITNKGSDFWRVFASALDEFCRRRLSMKVSQGETYLFSYSINKSRENLGFFSEIDVSAEIQFSNLTATRVDSHTLNDLSQDVLNLDAVVENREMLGWKVEVISSKDTLKFICSRVAEDSSDGEYISSVITVEELALCDKEFSFEVNDHNDKPYYSHVKNIEYPNGQVVTFK